MAEPKILLEGFCFLEAPRWRRDGLYVSDIRGEQVIHLGLDGQVKVLAEFETPCGMGWLPDGRLLIVAMNQKQLLRLEKDGSLSVHADFGKLAPYPINDMVVDGKGRAFVGQWGYDVFANTPPVAAPVLRADPDGNVAIAGGGILLANGIVMGRDDNTLIVTEMAGARLSAFDIAADGSLSKQRCWADLDVKRPDGICADAEGGIWVADFTGARFVRVLEGGKMTDVIEVPNRKAVACALGGADGKTLFMVTCAGRTDRAGSREDRGGRVETVQVAVPGCENP